MTVSKSSFRSGVKSRDCVGKGKGAKTSVPIKIWISEIHNQIGYNLHIYDRFVLLVSHKNLDF